MDSFYSWDIQAFSFSSAREALNYMEKNQHFDIAIVDLCMPNMSGLELAQSMRERGYIQPIIGLSSIGIDINGQEWFDHFTTKPISKSNLFELVLQCLITVQKKVIPSTTPLPSRTISTHMRSHSRSHSRSHTQTQTQTHSRSNSLSRSNSRMPSRSNSPSNIPIFDNSLRILIAEDDYYNQVLITEFLNTLGYMDITIVSNGRMCVEEAKTTKYDICLMDIKMPVMDGLDATRRLKKLAHPPVIIAVSASVLDADKNRCFAAGMDGYISKPIQKEQLKSVLENLKLRITK